MKPEQLPFAKLVSALFDSGLWARMSAGARALYPALLRFSDGNFKPVYPGTTRLMEMTGFKHKKSIREARKELVDLGLVSITAGSGGSNTYYHFRFDWAARGTPVTLRGIQQAPGAGDSSAPGEIAGSPGGGSPAAPPYNQIHITIHNHQEGREALSQLESRFGEDRVKTALSELNLAGMEATPANVERILSGRWKDLQSSLAAMLSPESMRILCEAFVAESGQKLLFSDSIPEHLKKILTRHGGRVEFVQSTDKALVR